MKSRSHHDRYHVRRSHGRSDPGKREWFRSGRYLCIRVSCWLDHIRGRKILLLPRVALQSPLQRDNPHEDFYRPCRHIRIVFINPGFRRDRTLRPVKGGLRPLNHTPEINNAEFYDNVIAGNFPDRFSGGNNPVPCYADLLAKAINPCGLAFGQLRCIRGKMRHIQTFH